MLHISSSNAAAAAVVAAVNPSNFSSLAVPSATSVTAPSSSKSSLSTSTIFSHQSHSSVDSSHPSDSHLRSNSSLYHFISKPKYSNTSAISTSSELPPTSKSNYHINQFMSNSLPSRISSLSSSISSTSSSYSDNSAPYELNATTHINPSNHHFTTSQLNHLQQQQSQQQQQQHSPYQNSSHLVSISNVPTSLQQHRSVNTLSTITTTPISTSCSSASSPSSSSSSSSSSSAFSANSSSTNSTFVEMPHQMHHRLPPITGSPPTTHQRLSPAAQLTPYYTSNVPNSHTFYSPNSIPSNIVNPISDPEQSSPLPSMIGSASNSYKTPPLTSSAQSNLQPQPRSSDQSTQSPSQYSSPSNQIPSALSKSISQVLSQQPSQSPTVSSSHQLPQASHPHPTLHSTSHSVYHPSLHYSSTPGGNNSYESQSSSNSPALGLHGISGPANTSGSTSSPNLSTSINSITSSCPVSSHASAQVLSTGGLAVSYPHSAHTTPLPTPTSLTSSTLQRKSDLPNGLALHSLGHSQYVPLLQPLTGTTGYPTLNTPISPKHVVGQQGRRGVIPSVTGTALGSVSKIAMPPKNEEGMYPCGHCNRQYKHLKHLKRHMLRHTGERPYRCRLCLDQFSRSDILKRHFQKCAERRGLGATELDHLEGTRGGGGTKGSRQSSGSLSDLSLNSILTSVSNSEMQCLRSDGNYYPHPHPQPHHSSQHYPQNPQHHHHLPPLPVISSKASPSGHSSASLHPVKDEPKSADMSNNQTAQTHHHHLLPPPLPQSHYHHQNHNSHHHHQDQHQHHTQHSHHSPGEDINRESILPSATNDGTAAANSVGIGIESNSGNLMSLHPALVHGNLSHTYFDLISNY